MPKNMHACLEPGSIGAMTWAEYVRRLIGQDTQMAVSMRTRIDQTTISRWLRGVTTPKNAADVAHFAQCYKANVLEAFVAAGFLSAEEAGVPPTPATTFQDLVDQDPDLSPEAKIHLKNQYGLLRAASAHSRVVELRDKILGDRELDQATREQLVALVEGHLESNNAHNIVLEPEPPFSPPRLARAAREETGHETPPEPDPNVDEPGPEHGA